MSLLSRIIKLEKLFGKNGFSEGVWHEFTMAIDATTTAPTKGTIVVDKARWRRVGDSMQIKYEYEQSAAGSAGSGDYLFPIPLGYSIDSNKTTLNTTGEVIVGSAILGSNGSALSNGVKATVLPYNANNLAIRLPQISSGAELVTADLANSARGESRLSNTAQFISFVATVPILGWGVK